MGSVEIEEFSGTFWLVFVNLGETRLQVSVPVNRASALLGPLPLYSFGGGYVYFDVDEVQKVITGGHDGGRTPNLLREKVRFEEVPLLEVLELVVADPNFKGSTSTPLQL